MASTATAAGRINAVLCQGATERVLGLGKYDTMGKDIPSVQIPYCEIS